MTTQDFQALADAAHRYQAALEAVVGGARDADTLAELGAAGAAFARLADPKIVALACDRALMLAEVAQ